MYCCSNENKRKHRGWYFLFIPVAIAAAITGFGFLVMLLWNAILPAVFGISTITFWQALGILVLSKILFGGMMHGPRHHRFHKHSHDYHKKWMSMSPEEREKFKAEWKEKCCHTPTEG